MEAVILAAGRGMRFGNITDKKPKPLIKVCGKPLIYWALKSLSYAGIDKAYIVTGYKHRIIENELTDTPIPIEFIYNSNWDKGNLTSLSTARKKVFKSFVLMMSDHLFDPTIIQDIVEMQQKKSCILAVQKKYQQDSGDTKVMVKNEEALSNGKKIIGNYVDCGLFRCTQEIFRYVNKCILKGNNELRDAMNLCAKDGEMQVMNINDRLFVDVDTTDDLRSYYVVKYEDEVWNH